MIDLLTLELVEKRLVTDQIVLDIGYDVENLTPARARTYEGEVATDRYGRKTPKHAHGTATLDRRTSSTRLLTDATLSLFDRIMDPRLTVRRVTVTAGRVLPESEAAETPPASGEQLDLFTDYDALEKEREAEAAALKRERARQETIIALRRKYGKNAVLKGMNLEEGATTRERNDRIGGHKA